MQALAGRPAELGQCQRATRGRQRRPAVPVAVRTRAHRFVLESTEKNCLRSMSCNLPGPLKATNENREKK